MPELKGVPMPPPPLLLLPLLLLLLLVRGQGWGVEVRRRPGQRASQANQEFSRTAAVC